MESLWMRSLSMRQHTQRGGGGSDQDWRTGCVKLWSTAAFPLSSSTHLDRVLELFSYFVLLAGFSLPLSLCV